MIRYRNQLLTLALLYGATHVSAQQIQKEFTDIQVIEIKTVSGNCILSKGKANTVSVELAHTIEGNYAPSAEQAGDKLIIKEKFGSGTSRGDALWTLTIPDNLEISFNSSSGSFEASDWKGRLNIKTSSGNIKIKGFSGNIESNSASGSTELKNVTGNIHVKTASGSIKCSDASSTGESLFNSGSGDIDIENHKGDFKANTGSGNVKLESITAKASASSGSGDVKAKNVALTGESRFSSGSGDAEVRLAKPLIHNISVSSGSGDSILDFDGIKISGEIAMTANKKNGRIKAPFDFDKEEEIEAGNQIKLRKTVQLGNDDIQINVSTGSGTSEIRK